MAVSAAANGVLHAAALTAALQTVALRLAHEGLVHAADSTSKGATRCLRSALALLTGDGCCCCNDADGCSCRGEGAGSCTYHHLHHHHHSVFDVMGYAQAAFSGFYATVTTAFHEKSYWTAAALLDVVALWSVWRQHKHVHAEAAAAASLRRAALDPANPATTAVPRPGVAEMALLQCAAAHGKAAYGAPAASGHVSSALGYLSLVTVGQATRKAPRNIPPAAHLRGVQQLTGCPPGDVLAAQWTAHLHRPAFYVALDRQRQTVVVSVRGTLQLGDYCTVLDAVPQPATLRGVSGHVHGGFLSAARNLLPPVCAALQAAAQACPGWPVLLCGHSLGGGVAAVLTMLLLEQREAWEQQQQWQPQQQGQQQQLWGQLGELRCVGVGAAAAFCQTLGMACKQHVTSVLYGADCLPMFSVLGARLLIEEVHAKSKAAAAVGCILRRTRLGRWRTGSGGSSSEDSGSPTSLARTVSSASSATSSASCELLCGAGGCRGLCCVADSVAELAEVEEVAAAAGNGKSHLQRCASAWSTASTASIAAFASDVCSGSACGAGTDRGAALVPMFPAGRILWLLPPSTGEQPTAADASQQQQQQQQQGQQTAVPQLVETDQSAFERFLFTTETATVHLPDWYINAIDAVASAEAGDA